MSTFYNIPLRNCGMCSAALQAAYTAQGGVIIIAKTLHCKKIIQYLNEHGVDTIAVAAYLDPNNFKKFHTEYKLFKKPHQDYL